MAGTGYDISASLSTPSSAATGATKFGNVTIGGITTTTAILISIVVIAVVGVFVWLFKGGK